MLKLIKKLIAINYYKRSDVTETIRFIEKDGLITKEVTSSDIAAIICTDTIFSPLEKILFLDIFGIKSKQKLDEILLKFASLFSPFTANSEFIQFKIGLQKEALIKRAFASITGRSEESLPSEIMALNKNDLLSLEQFSDFNLCSLYLSGANRSLLNIYTKYPFLKEIFTEYQNKNITKFPQDFTQYLKSELTLFAHDKFIDVLKKYKKNLKLYAKLATWLQVQFLIGLAPDDTLYTTTLTKNTDKFTDLLLATIFKMKNKKIDFKNFKLTIKTQTVTLYTQDGDVIAKSNKKSLKKKFLKQMQDELKKKRNYLKNRDTCLKAQMLRELKKLRNYLEAKHLNLQKQIISIQVLRNFLASLATTKNDSTKNIDAVLGITSRPQQFKSPLSLKNIAVLEFVFDDSQDTETFNNLIKKYLFNVKTVLITKVKITLSKHSHITDPLDRTKKIYIAPIVNPEIIKIFYRGTLYIFNTELHLLSMAAYDSATQKFHKVNLNKKLTQEYIAWINAKKVKHYSAKDIVTTPQILPVRFKEKHVAALRSIKLPLPEHLEGRLNDVIGSCHPIKLTLPVSNDAKNGIIFVQHTAIMIKFFLDGVAKELVYYYGKNKKPQLFYGKNFKIQIPLKNTQGTISLPREAKAVSQIKYFFPNYKNYHLIFEFNHQGKVINYSFREPLGKIKKAQNKYTLYPADEKSIVLIQNNKHPNFMYSLAPIITGLISIEVFFPRSQGNLTIMLPELTADKETYKKTHININKIYPIINSEIEKNALENIKFFAWCDQGHVKAIFPVFKQRVYPPLLFNIFRNKKKLIATRYAFNTNFFMELRQQYPEIKRIQLKMRSSITFPMPFEDFLKTIKADNFLKELIH